MDLFRLANGLSSINENLKAKLFTLDPKFKENNVVAIKYTSETSKVLYLDY